MSEISIVVSPTMTPKFALPSVFRFSEKPSDVIPRKDYRINVNHNKTNKKVVHGYCENQKVLAIKLPLMKTQGTKTRKTQ